MFRIWKWRKKYVLHLSEIILTLYIMQNSMEIMKKWVKTSANDGN